MNHYPQDNHNPYQAPAATMMPHAHASGALIDNGRRVGAERGLAWIGSGWEAFKAFPVAWIIFSIVYLVLLVALSVIPIVNFFSIVITPVFVAGIMLASRDAEQGQAPSVARLLNGFTSHLGRLALVGLLFMVCVIGITFIVGIAVALLAGVGMITHETRWSLGMLLVILLGCVLFLPLVISFYYAPGLIVLHDLGALAAMKMSFYGVLKNWSAFLVYGIAAVLLMLLGMLPLLLGLLVTYPILLYSLYASYKEIYVS